MSPSKELTLFTMKQNKTNKTHTHAIMDFIKNI